MCHIYGIHFELWFFNSNRKLARVGFKPTVSCLPCTRFNHWALWPNDEMCHLFCGDMIRCPPRVNSASVISLSMFLKKIKRSMIHSQNFLYAFLPSKRNYLSISLKYHFSSLLVFLFFWLFLFLYRFPLNLCQRESVAAFLYSISGHVENRIENWNFIVFCLKAA